MMNASPVRLRQRLLGMAMLAAGLAAPGLAQAASYNILLKNSSGTIHTCVTPAGFTFNKGTSTGTFSTTGASVKLTSCPTSFVPSIANGTYGPGALNVVVENATINGEAQGPNVVGLSGTLTFSTTAGGTCAGTGSTSSSKVYTITFAYSPSTAPTPNPAARTYTITCSGSGNFTTSGLYHVNNTSPIPEPESLWLAALALAAAVGSRRVFARRGVASRTR